MKLFLCVIMAGSLALSTAFGQTAQMTGTVVTVTPTVITVQKGTEVWDIKRTATTTVTGDLKPASQVTINYNTIDAQKKELPTTGGTPTPASG